MIAANRQRGACTTQLDQSSIQAQHGTRIALLGGHVHRLVVGSQGQPGSDLTEARVGTVVPLHRRPLGVTPASETGQAPLHRVLDRLGRNWHVLHADLVALVQRRRAAQGQQQHRGHASLRSADAAGHALPVVIAEHPVRPGAGRQRRLVRVDERGDVARVPGGKDQVKVEGQMQAAAAHAVVGHQPLDRQPELTDQHALGVGIREIAKLSDQLQQLGLIGGMNGQQRFVWRLRRRPPGVRRVVAQLDGNHRCRVRTRSAAHPAWRRGLPGCAS